MILKLKSAGSIFLICTFFSCHESNILNTYLKERLTQDKAIITKLQEQGRKKDYINAKFWLYCSLADTFGVNNVILGNQTKKDTIYYFSMDALAYQANLYNDTTSINFEFFKGIISNYDLMGYQTLNGLELKSGRIVKIKYGDDTKVSYFENSNITEKNFLKDTTIAFDIFRQNRNYLNKWLYEECLKRKIFN